MEMAGKDVCVLGSHTKNLNYEKAKQQVFIVGCKGIPANYGGFETFVEKLTEYQKSGRICYHVFCMGNENFQFEYNGARCIKLRVPNIGAARAIYYDAKALQWGIDYCKNHTTIRHPIFYVLACRIGPFISYYKRQIEQMGGVLYVNPDGHEWMRAKWGKLVRKYWKLSEKMMTRQADLLICDSVNIEKYIKNTYAKYKPKTRFIAYGSDLKMSTLSDDATELLEWYLEKRIQKKEYYLVVGRFVPENSFEIMIREFMKSNSKRDFVIITTANKKLLNKLERKFHFGKDSRIKFVGTVYNQELLKKIRENAYAYLHGHTVGGTNPSLIEALGSTDLNLLIDVGFNREVAEDSALYWDDEEGNLAKLINQVDVMDEEKIRLLGKKAKKRVSDEYTWKKIVESYETLFLADTKMV